MVVPGFSGGKGDWCIPLLQDIAIALDRSHELQVYTTCYPAFSAMYVVDKVAVRSFGDGKSGRLAWARRHHRAITAIVDDHDQTPFDVLHGFWADGGGVVAARVKRQRPIPTLVSVMGGELTFEPGAGYGKKHRHVAGRLARYGAHRADRLLALSPFHRHAIQSQNAGFNTEQMNCGVDHEKFAPTGGIERLKGKIPVLCVASLVAVKGIAGLIRAFAELARRNESLHLHVVGEGPLLPNLRQQARELHAPVTFHGQIDHANLAAYYRGASFCVLNSWFESYGMVVAEAAACGRLTIGTNVGSMPIFCPQDFLSEPGNESQLANNIVAAANHSTILSPLRAPPDIEQSTSELLDHYATTLQSSK